MKMPTAAVWYAVILGTAKQDQHGNVISAGSLGCATFRLALGRPALKVMKSKEEVAQPF